MDVLNELREIMRTDINDMRSFIDPKHLWMDAVDARLKVTGERDSVSVDSMSPQDRYVYRILGHIIPFQPSDRKALIETYVYSKNGKENSSVNYSPERTHQFLSEILATAKRCGEDRHSDNFMDRHSGMRNLYFLHGPKGSGKTYFLNHLFAKFCEQIESQKIVWVRIDLTTSCRENEDLTHSILRETARVIFRYYHDLAVNLIDDFKAIASSNKAPYLLFEDFIRFLDSRQDRSAEWPIDLEKVPKAVVREIFRLALGKGYRFVIVLDSFDRLEALISERKQFYALVQGLGDLIVNKRLLNAAIIVATRTFTYDNIVRKGLPFTSPHEVLDCGVKRVSPADTEAIFSRRLDYIASNVSKNAQKSPDTINSGRDDIPDRFMAYLQQKYDSIPKLAKDLDSVFFVNIRAKMQALQLLFYQFVQRGEIRKYRLTEDLITAGRNFPPRPYSYRFDERGRIERVVDNCFLIDKPLPPIFSFPLIKSKKKQLFPKGHGLLVGLRMMQLVEAHDRVGQKATGYPHAPLVAWELAQICETLFDYELELVISLVEEYGEFQLFELTGIEFATPSVPAAYQIQPLPKMKHLLNDLLYDVGYLNICSMRVPLPSKWVEHEDPLLRASSIELDGLQFWVASKLLNAISIYRLIRHMNSLQESKFANRMKSINSERYRRTVSQAYEEGMFEFINRMESSVTRQLALILQSMKSVDEAYFLKRLSQYKVKWVNGNKGRVTSRID